MTQPFNFKRPVGWSQIESFIDPSATLGEGSRAWWYSVILAGVRIGCDAQIGARSEIGRDSIIGDRSRIGSGVFLPPNTIIGADVFIGPNVTCTDDMHPRVRRDADGPYDAKPPIIEDHANIGAGVTLCPGVRIGHHAVVAAGALVTSDVLPHTMVKGVPARQFTPSGRARAAYLKVAV